MLRHLVRITGVLLTFFSLALSFMVGGAQEGEYPLGTTSMLLLNTQTAQFSKADLVQGLQDLATRENIRILKPVADPANPRSGRNVIAFGEGSEGEVPWFSANFSGRFIDPQEVSTEPLDGSYYISDCRFQCRERILGWARTSGVSASWFDRPPLHDTAADALLHTGSGLAMFSAGILMVTVCLTWFTAQGRSRAIRLLGGVSVRRIHLQDLGEFGALLLLPGLATLLGGCLFLGLYYSWQTVRVLIPSLVLINTSVLAAVLACLLVLTFLFSPQINLWAKRENLWKPAYRVGLALRASAVILVVVSLPLAASNVVGAYQSARQQEGGNALADSYILLFTQAAFTAQEETEVSERVRKMFSSMAADRVLFSVAMDSLVEVPPGIGTGYDHLILSNQPFLDTVNRVPLVDADPADISPDTLEFIKDNLIFWSRDHSTLPSFRLMRPQDHTGVAVPALLSGIRSGGSLSANRPLLIVLEAPAQQLDPTGLLLPAVVNGSFLYQDYSQLLSILQDSGMSRYYAGIDNAGALLIQNSQNLQREAWLGGVGVLLAVGSLFTSLVQAAMIWSYRRRQEIFLSATSGYAFPRLALPPAALESAFVFAAVTVFGYLFTKTSGGVPLVLTLPALGGFALLYGLAALAAYAQQAHRAFISTLDRSA